MHIQFKILHIEPQKPTKKPKETKITQKKIFTAISCTILTKNPLIVNIFANIINNYIRTFFDNLVTRFTLCFLSLHKNNNQNTSGM
ncbi:hypothetical protein AT705_00815 [Pseudoalteromonas rubra]|uniref:Uncharacterized protein n=1 Tax=Pseudoalteromonas rubra TaxID=43658 RepID=A0A0U3GQZ1_9GAMM|nr:hypothetical protein AT705_00815 [Pseudoalteromonas rubra]